MDKLSHLLEIVSRINEDIYGLIFVLTGCVLSLAGHKEEGMLVLGAGCAIFKGKS
jgi:hypothetical protein